MDAPKPTRIYRQWISVASVLLVLVLVTFPSLSVPVTVLLVLGGAYYLYHSPSGKNTPPATVQLQRLPRKAPQTADTTPAAGKPEEDRAHEVAVDRPVQTSAASTLPTERATQQANATKPETTGTRLEAGRATPVDSNSNASGTPGTAASPAVKSNIPAAAQAAGPPLSGGAAVLARLRCAPYLFAEVAI